MLDIAEVSNGYEVKFQYKPWLVSAIKQIPGARFNGGTKHWWVPASSGTALTNWAKTFGVTIGKATEEQIGEIEPLPELDINIDDVIYHRERKAKGESHLLYHYQKTGIAYALLKRRLINGDDMGLGKTAQSIATLVAGGANCILVICPATLKENWKREWKLWAGRESLIMTDRIKKTWPQFYRVGMVNVFICNYESLKKYFVEKIDKHLDDEGKEKPLRLNHIHFTESINLFDAVVIDELHRCFTYETTVLTNKGLVQIGDIVENKIKGLLAASCDLETGEIQWKPITKHWRNELGNRKIYRIRHNEGELYATGDHKIFTASGRYKKVSEIEEGEGLFLVRKGVHDNQTRSKVLLTGMRREITGSERGVGRETAQQAEAGTNKENMCLVRGRIFNDQKEIRSNEEVLRPELQCKMESENSGSHRNEQVSAEAGEGKVERYQADAKPSRAEGSLGTNEEKQSDVQSGNSGESKEGQYRKNLSRQGWQWEVDGTAEVITLEADQYGSNGTRNSNTAGEVYFSEPAQSLQSGYSRSGDKTGDRSGRSFPYAEEVEIPGQKEDGCFKLVRVESCEVYQPADNGGYQSVSFSTGIVYDIEVADNHNYFADGILVSNCKDGRRQVSKFVMGITKGKEWVLGLTGTPVVNKPKDLVAQLHIISRLEEFGGYKRFTDRYCSGEREASNLKELNFRLHKYGFYRRLKKEVLTDLPDKIRNILLVDIETRKEYDKAENNLIEYLRENLQKSEGEITTALRGQAMVLIGILKKIAAKGKIPAMLEHIQEVVDAGEKIVVFAWHKEIVYELKKAIPGAVTVVGDDSMDERQRAVDSFQNNPRTQVIICNIASGGVGITLTASSRVSFIELPWHPAHADQAEDRCWRIGQKNCVQAAYVLGENTIDKDIYDIIEKKRQIVAQVTGAENDIETSVIDDFINLFKTKF